MTMTFAVTLTCACCKAALHFENERPAWKTYDFRVEQAEECERSARFVSEHADKALPERGERPEWWPDRRVPRFIALYVCEPITTWKEQRQLTLAIPDPYRYVDCPVCDKHVKEPS